MTNEDDTRRRIDVRLPAGEMQRRAITGSVWTAIHTLVYLPVAFTANAIIARTLGVSSYGRLAFLTALLAFAVPLANFGFSNAFIQRGSREEATGHRGAVDELLGRSLGFYMIVELPILVVLAAAMTWDDPLWEVMALGAAVVLTCLLSGGMLSLVVENRTAAGAKLAIGVNVIVQSASVLAAVLTQSAVGVWVVRALVPALALGLNFFFLDRIRARSALRPRLPRGLGVRFWRYSLLSWAAGLLGLLVFSRSEIFLLEYFHKHEALGLFAVAFGLSQQMTAPADALLLPLLPAVAGILSTWPERALAAFERSTRLSALVCGAIASGVVPVLVFAIPLVYGKGFSGASWFLVPLALTSMLQSVNNPVTAFVAARERGGLRLRATAVALIVDVAVAIALIPHFGAWGAVVANVAGQLTALGWLAATEPLARSQGLQGLLALYKPFFLGVTTASVALLAGAAAQRSSTLAAATTAFVLGVFLYLAALKLSRSGLTPADRDALVGAMPPATHRLLIRVLRPITSTIVSNS